MRTDLLDAAPTSSAPLSSSTSISVAVARTRLCPRVAEKKSGSAAPSRTHRADLGLRGEYPRKRADLGLRGEYPLSPAERAIALVATMTRMRALLSRHSMEVSDFGCCREMDQKATNELVCSSAATQTRCSVLTPSLYDWGEGEQGDGLLEGAVGQCSSQDLAAMTWELQGRGCNRGARRGCVSMHVTRAALPQ